MPESPDVSPDGKEVAFAALQSATGDIFIANLETGQVRNLTNDQFGDYAPTYSPDGKSLIYLSRVSGNDKLFRWDFEKNAKTQITFGTHDDGGVQFIDDDTIVFPSTATDPNQPLDAEVARNGNIYNIWTLNLKTGELRQFTDALTGNVSPVVLRDQKPGRIAFVTYYKGEYGIHTLTRDEPLHTVASADFGSPGPIIDFTPPLSHTMVPQNVRRKGTFEKLFLEGRPPVALGVTSGGDVFGGTQVTFTDVLGDKQFNFFAASVSQYRTFNGSYINLSRRFQYAIQGFSQKQFFYGYDPAALYGVQYGFIDRDTAIATQTEQGGSASAIYPLNRYARFQLSCRAAPVQAGIRRTRPAADRRRLPAVALRPQPLQQRHLHAARCDLRAGDDDLPRIRAALGGHDVARLRVRAQLRQPAVAPDVRRRRPLLPAPGHERRARIPRPRLQELG